MVINIRKNTKKVKFSLKKQQMNAMKVVYIYIQLLYILKFDSKHSAIKCRVFFKTLITFINNRLLVKACYC